MGSSTQIADYVGQGTAADRPAPASLDAFLGPGASAIYAETDTGNVFALIAGAWVQINGGGGGGATGDTWNASLIGAGPAATLSADRYTAFSAEPGGWKQVQGTNTYTSANGKIYFEYICLGGDGDGFFGCAGPGSSLATYPGNASGFGRGYDGNTLSAWGGSTANGNSWANNGIVLGVALDIPDGSVSFLYNDTPNGGITGMTIPAPGAVLAAAFNTNLSGQGARIRSTAAQCVFAPPAGYNYAVEG